MNSNTNLQEGFPAMRLFFSLIAVAALASSRATAQALPVPPYGPWIYAGEVDGNNGMGSIEDILPGECLDLKVGLQTDYASDPDPFGGPFLITAGAYFRVWISVGSTEIAVHYQFQSGYGCWCFFSCNVYNIAPAGAVWTTEIVSEKLGTSSGVVSTPVTGSDSCLSIGASCAVLNGCPTTAGPDYFILPRPQVAYPPVNLRVSPKRVLSSVNGLAPTVWGNANSWPPDDAVIDAVIASASDLLMNTAGISLTNTGLVDLIDPDAPPFPSWFDVDVTGSFKKQLEMLAKGDPCRYGWRDDSINIYFVNSITKVGDTEVHPLAEASYPLNGDAHDIMFVAVPQSTTDLGLELAHEIGHYLNLRHTHASFESTAPNDCGGQSVPDCCPGGATYGDCVSDTPDDANYFMYKDLSQQAFNDALHDLNYPPELEKLIRYNIMSYHFPNNAPLLTCGQAQRARDAIFSYRAGVINMTGDPTPMPCLWQDLAKALPGSNGVPRLEGEGELTAGSAGFLSLASARGAALSWIVGSVAFGPAPFKGGLLAPVPYSFIGSTVTTGAGTAMMSWSMWPAGLGGIDLYFQFVIQDPVAVKGFALSNCLRASVP